MSRSAPVEQVLKRLQSLADPANVVGMARFGIRPKKVYGIATPELKGIARRIGREHRLALDLWKTGIHEARVLASLVADPVRFSEGQMERWVKDLDSWAICDACCFNLFGQTELAHTKALEWSTRSREFEKRAGFALMASLAFHDKKAPDSRMLEFLSCIEQESWDERNFVKKAVNWALRQIGKRNRKLNRAALRSAKAIQKLDSKAARWIAADALKELTSEAVQRRLLTTSFRKMGRRIHPAARSRSEKAGRSGVSRIRWLPELSWGVPRHRLSSQRFKGYSFNVASPRSQQYVNPIARKSWCLIQRTSLRHDGSGLRPFAARLASSFTRARFASLCAKKIACKELAGHEE